MRRPVTEPKSPLDELTRRCRAAGMAVTPQRIAVYRALVASHDHPTPDLLHARVRDEMPSMSLATVYKALNALERIGLVNELAVFSEAARFDANLDHHHHLICTDCKKVIDYYDDDLSGIRPGKIPGFVAESVAVRIVGKCSDCAAKSRTRRSVSTTQRDRREQR